MRAPDNHPEFVGGSFVSIKNSVLIIQDEHYFGQQINNTPILREKKRSIRHSSGLKVRQGSLIGKTLDKQ
jgi:hypothetical protein